MIDRRSFLKAAAAIAAFAVVPVRLVAGLRPRRVAAPTEPPGRPVADLIVDEIALYQEWRGAPRQWRGRGHLDPGAGQARWLERFERCEPFRIRARFAGHELDGEAIATGWAIRYERRAFRIDVEFFGHGALVRRAA